MTEDPMPMGGNAKTEINRRVDRRIALVEQIAELTEEMKTYRAEDKSDGFNEKTIARGVKEKIALKHDPDKLLAQLMLEAEYDVVRHALGIPTDIETAQRLAKEDAETLPEPKRERSSKDDDKVVPLKPDKTKH